MAAAASARPLLALTSLLLALAVAVESYSNPPSSASASTASATGAAEEDSFNPKRLCVNATSPELCVEVLPTIPGLGETPPEYRALAVLLDQHAWTTLQSATVLAHQMRAAVPTYVTKARTHGAVGEVDWCVESCAQAVKDVNNVFADLRKLPEMERLRGIHVALAAIFHDGGEDAPLAYTSECPEDSSRKAADAAMFAKFRYLYSVLDLLELVLTKVFAGEENDGSPPPQSYKAL
uniref:Pectinesterase inhibitor domain-containing protein n=1 Tax=Leersia perrieri TaxID=77586 RepID=A0A0D9XR23_9ORYZ